MLACDAGLSKVVCTPKAELLAAFKKRFCALLSACGPLDVVSSVKGLTKLEVDILDLVPEIFRRAVRGCHVYGQVAFR